jgi:tyrosinase
MRGTSSPVRESVNGLNAAAPVLKKYASAVGLLKNLGGSDPRNWTNLATVHNDFCPHGNWWFLPWHRAYLHYFELACQDVLRDTTFRLPYWDWTRYPRIPGPFLASQSTLWDDTRDNDGNIELGTEIVGLGVVQKVVGASNWNDVFSGATPTDKQRLRTATGVFEGTPHNGVHSIIGGDMGSLMSPLDPIFWLHHCNIDRIWVSWSRISGHTPPSDDLWKNHKLTQFYDPITKKQVSPEVTETLDAGRFGSSYDSHETPALPGRLLTQSLRSRLSEEAAPSSSSLLRRFSLDAVENSPLGHFAGFTAAMSPDFGAVLERAIQPAASGPHNADVSLVIEDVTRPQIPSVALRVFLNCKNPSLGTPLDDPTYVGTLAFFGEDHGAAHSSGSTYSLDVSQTLARTIRAGIYTLQSPIDVSLVPVDLRNPRSAPPGPAVKAEKVRLVGLATA